MGSSLFKMPFDEKAIETKLIYRSDSLEDAAMPALSSEKINTIYGELSFMEDPKDRPYLYTSLVTSIDGKIAFSDAPQGPLIAKLNQYDEDGATVDWWILNMLRSVSDGVFIGAGTMAAERDYTAHVFDQDLEDARVAEGMNPVPWNVISSLDGSDIPFDHILFEESEVPVMISTSAEGLQRVKENIRQDYLAVGPYQAKEEITDEVISSMKEAVGKIIVIATGDKAPDSELALYILKKFGMNKMLVETPSYMHYLVSLGMMDELFFNYSCIYVGGQALSIGKFGKEFGSKDHPHTKMLSIHAHSDHFFYFRHKLIYSGLAEQK